MSSINNVVRVESKNIMTNGKVVNGGLFVTFFRYSFTSTLGLISLTTASIVDGLYVGRYVGSDALAAINILIPVLTFFFATILMISVGGAIQAAHDFGKNNIQDAEDSFKQSFFLVAFCAFIFFVFSYFFYDLIFAILSVPESIYSLLKNYFRILAFGFPFLFVAVVHYYFLRCADKPMHASLALVFGALSNIVLDAVFVGYLNMGIEGAAKATVISQVVQCVILMGMMRYFKVFPIGIPSFNIARIFPALMNGFSEFINEVSAGLVIGCINFLALKHFGTPGVAAFAVVNYIIFTCIMLCYGLVDSLHVLVGKNYGANNTERMMHFFSIACVVVFCLCLVILVIVFFGFNSLVYGFIPHASSYEYELIQRIMLWIWPVFLFIGLNLCVNAFLTATGQASVSACVSALRSLILPILLLLILGLFFYREDFLIALPVSEVITACILWTIFFFNLRKLKSSAKSS